MKCVAFTVLTALVVAGASGCITYRAPVMPALGWVYSEVKAPLDVDLGGTTLGSKVGRAQVESILALVSTGDCSIQAAAASAGIKTVNHVDYEYYNVLGVIQRFTVIVYGD